MFKPRIILLSTICVFLVTLLSASCLYAKDTSKEQNISGEDQLGLSTPDEQAPYLNIPYLEITGVSDEMNVTEIPQLPSVPALRGLPDVPGVVGYEEEGHSYMYSSGSGLKSVEYRDGTMFSENPKEKRRYWESGLQDSINYKIEQNDAEEYRGLERFGVSGDSSTTMYVDTYGGNQNSDAAVTQISYSDVIDGKEVKVPLDSIDGASDKQLKDYMP